MNNINAPAINDGTIREDVQRALAEDIGPGDLSAQLIPPDAAAEASVVSRESAVLCGTAWFNAVFTALDESVEITWNANDGDTISVEQTLCDLSGTTRALLTGERTALNFLQTLSATATLAGAYTQRVQNTGCLVLDTRKTLPGLRAAQKYATACGGAVNHRLGLFDGILIKENHIIAAGGLSNAVDAARQLHPDRLIEVEVENLDELDTALATGAEIIMLDNFSVPALREAVARNGGRAKLEASGGVTLETVRVIAMTGVDYVSVGDLTKNVRAIDLSMRFRL